VHGCPGRCFEGRTGRSDTRQHGEVESGNGPGTGVPTPAGGRCQPSSPTHADDAQETAQPRHSEATDQTLPTCTDDLLGTDSDAQLGTLRREPSAALVASALPQARIRVDQVTAAARSIRIQALALDGPGSPNDVDLRRLVSDIDGEAQALAQWRTTYRELAGG
jgi:hypothetical protein